MKIWWIFELKNKRRQNSVIPWGFANEAHLSFNQKYSEEKKAIKNPVNIGFTGFWIVLHDQNVEIRGIEPLTLWLPVTTKWFLVFFIFHAKVINISTIIVFTCDFVLDIYDLFIIFVYSNVYSGEYTELQI